MNSDTEKLNQLLREVILAQWMMFIVITLLLFISFYVVRFIRDTNKRLEAQAIELMKQEFIATAHKLNDLGEYSELLIHSMNRKREFPHDINSHWFAAQALYKKQQLGNALSMLNELKEIDPVWNKDVVEERMDTIKSLMNGPTNV